MKTVRKIKFHAGDISVDAYLGSDESKQRAINLIEAYDRYCREGKTSNIKAMKEAYMIWAKRTDAINRR